MLKAFTRVVLWLGILVALAWLLIVLQFVYRSQSFSASLDDQVAMIEALCDLAPLSSDGQTGSEWLSLRNVWPNACFGAYYVPEDAAELEAMRKLTHALSRIANRASSETILESIQAAYNLLDTTGYNPEFIDRHRNADVHGLRQVVRSEREHAVRP